MDMHHSRADATGPPVYKSLRRPEANTSRLARFVFTGDLATYNVPVASAIQRAQVEIAAKPIGDTCGLLVAPQGIVRLGTGGYKSRDPLLSIVPRGDKGFDLAATKIQPLKLTHAAYHLVYEPSRRLLFLTDSSRIKSYRLDDDGRALPVHTFRADNGPLVLSEDGSILFEFSRRGGRTAQAWRLDDQPTHGADGRSLVGKRMGSYELDSASAAMNEPNGTALRDIESSSQIERSRGSKRSFTLTVKDCWIGRCTDVVRNNQIFAATGRDVFSVDLQGQRVVAHFVGHGGDISFINPIGTREDAFMTSSRDGIVRLYDSRSPFANMSLVGMRDSAVGWHVDAGGQQCAFSGTEPAEMSVVFVGGWDSAGIHCFDLRAKAVLYELSTGNGSVSRLRYDNASSTLVAATTRPQEGCEPHQS